MPGRVITTRWSEGELAALEFAAGVAGVSPGVFVKREALAAARAIGPAAPEEGSGQQVPGSGRGGLRVAGGSASGARADLAPPAVRRRSAARGSRPGESAGSGLAVPPAAAAEPVTLPAGSASLGDVVLERLRGRFGGRATAAMALQRIRGGRVTVGGVVELDPAALVDPGGVRLRA